MYPMDFGRSASIMWIKGTGTLYFNTKSSIHVYSCAAGTCKTHAVKKASVCSPSSPICRSPGHAGKHRGRASAHHVKTEWGGSKLQNENQWEDQSHSWKSEEERQSDLGSPSMEIYELEQVHQFKHLGSTITDDRRSEREVRIRIAMGEEAFEKHRK